MFSILRGTVVLPFLIWHVMAKEVSIAIFEGSSCDTSALNTVASGDTSDGCQDTTLGSGQFSQSNDLFQFNGYDAPGCNINDNVIYADALCLDTCHNSPNRDFSYIFTRDDVTECGTGYGESCTADNIAGLEFRTGNGNCNEAHAHVPSTHFGIYLPLSMLSIAVYEANY